MPDAFQSADASPGCQNANRLSEEPELDALGLDELVLVRIGGHLLTGPSIENDDALRTEPAAMVAQSIAVLPAPITATRRPTVIAAASSLLCSI